MKKVLIFGISGFVGAYLARELFMAGYKVIGSDLNKPNIFMDDVLFYNANLMNSEEVNNLIMKIVPDMIINLAAISSVGISWNNPQATIMVNVVGALNIMEAGRKLEKKPRIMFVGSSEEYEESENKIDENTKLNANNPYGISKVTQENFAKIYRERYGMKIYCVRPFNHTGVGQSDTFVLPSFCKQVAEIQKTARDGVIKVGNLSAKRDFSHVKDIVRAYRMIIESDNCEKIYNVGSGCCYCLEELLQYVIKLSNQKIIVEVDKERFRPCDTPIICSDIGLIKSDLGWEPQYTVFDALKEMFNNYLCD